MRATDLAWYLLLLVCWIAIGAFEVATFRRYWRCAQPDPMNSSIGALRSLEFLVVQTIQVASVVWAISLVPRGPVQAFAATDPVLARYFYAAVALPVSGLFWLCFRYLEHAPFPRWRWGKADLDTERTLWLVQFLLWSVPFTAAFVALGGIARG